VDGRAGTLFPDGGRHIVEIDFAEPAALSRVFIGGTPACAAWGQNWRGAVFEAVALDAPPSEGARRAVLKYLSLRYGVAGLPPADQADAAEARALGLDTHGCFGTRMIFR